MQYSEHQHHTKMNLACAALWIAFLLFQTAIPTPPTFADITITKIGDSVVDPNGLTLNGAQWGPNINGMIGQRDTHTTYKNYQYVAYYDAARHVCVARRKLPDGAWDFIRLLDYKTNTNDSHNVIGMGICPNDGTIHLAFDHHVHPLHYRRSKAGLANHPETMPWSTQMFDGVTSQLGVQYLKSLTYPLFYQTPQGELQFIYRFGHSGEANRLMVDYDSTLSTWTLKRQIDSGGLNFYDVFGTSTSRNTYPNDYTYDSEGKLHVTFTWREGAWGVNHDVNYAYSTDLGKTWRNNAGEVFKMQYPRIDAAGLVVVPVSTRMGLLNGQAQTVDAQNRVHSVMYHATTPSTSTVTPPGVGGDPAAPKRYFHYWRDESGVWHETMLGWSSGRPNLVADAESNLFLIYRNGSRLEIAGATAATQWTDWKVLRREDGPFFNDMLPDLARWRDQRVLSIFAQEKPTTTSAPSAIRIIDFIPMSTNAAKAGARNSEMYGN